MTPTVAERATKNFMRVVMPFADRDPETVAFFLVLTLTKGVDGRAKGSIYSLWNIASSEFVHDAAVLSQAA